jgi:hypothetical protein
MIVIAVWTCLEGLNLANLTKWSTVWLALWQEWGLGEYVCRDP